MVKIKEENITYEIIYLCDDSLGFPNIISKELKVPEEKIIKELQRLIKEGFLTKYSEEEIYNTTERGKKFLEEDGMVKKETLKNEFRETIPLSTLKKISKQIIILSPKQIDRFVYSCGWSDSERGSNMALPDDRINLIKSDSNYALKFIQNLFYETPREQFINAFDLRNKSLVKTN